MEQDQSDHLQYKQRTHHLVKSISMSFKFKKGDIIKPKDEYKEVSWYKDYVNPYRKVIKVHENDYFRLTRRRNDKPEDDFNNVWTEYFELAVPRPEPEGAADLIQEILGLLNLKESALRHEQPV